MANNTLTSSIIAAEALMILENELGWLETIHRSLEDEWDQRVNGYKPGATITIRRPADFTVRDGATMQVQDAIEGSIPVTIDKQKGVDFQFTSQEMTMEMTGKNGLSERVIKPAMISLVSEITRDVMSTMYKGIYNWVGTPGQLINSYSDFMKGPERLNYMSVPMDRRSGVLSPGDHAALLGSQTALYIQDAAKGAYRDAQLGRLSGVDTYMSQVVPTHTCGTRDNTTPLVKGASQNVTWTSVKTTWQQTLDTDGWDNSVTLKAGDVFTIDSVYMVNARTKATTAILQQFVVLEDVTAHASGGTTTLTISPPIITSGPHQTVSAAPANDAAITVMGTASANYDQNMIYHKNTMALCMVPMELPSGAVNPSRKSHNGFSVRVIPVYDGTNDNNKWRLDVLYGRKVIDPRLATRISGT